MDKGTGNGFSMGTQTKVVVVSNDPASILWAKVSEHAPWVMRHVLPSDLNVIDSFHPEIIFIDAQLEAHECAAIPTGICITAVVADSYSSAVLSQCLSLGYDTCVLRGGTLEDVLTVIRPELAKKRSATGAGKSALTSMPHIMGKSLRITDVWRFAMRAAATSASVLVTGETGAGKEIVAQMVHRFSPRRHGPFVAVNCAALPESLLEAELFGHEKGAFTGATTRRLGRFERANGGTLFLDEIGEVAPAMQVKLLRILQDKQFERIGGSETLTVNVRIVAATNRNIDDEIKRGRFRADLYYRLNVLNIHIPPLRERADDILDMWSSCLHDAASQEGRSTPVTPVDVSRKILHYNWPGNVRQLQNAASHAIAVCSNAHLTVADLPGDLCTAHTQEKNSTGFVGLSMGDIERRAILQTFEAIGTVKGTAELLGISVRKVHYRLKQYQNDGHFHRKHQDNTAKANIQQLRVLLAEDDDDVRFGLTDFLKAQGYDVVAVANGSAVLEYLGGAALFSINKPHPDVILTDIRMPGVSGLRILEGVRDKGWDVPVVIISAFCDNQTRIQAQSLGAAAFLEKPIDIAALETTLENIARKAVN